MKLPRSIAWIAGLGLVVSIGIMGCSRGPKFKFDDHAIVATAVVNRFAATAYSEYREAWQATEQLRAHIESFLANPTALGLVQARTSWATAHAAFAQTEALRLPGSPAHSMQPESPYTRIGLWPVNPADLDSVPGKLLTGVVHDTSKSAEVTQAILLEAHDPSKGTIVMGFHALEFMIYGFDQYDDGNGTRAFTDYTGGKGAERRGKLLRLLAENLTADLQELVDTWRPSSKGNYRDKFLKNPSATSLAGILTTLSDLCASGLNGGVAKALQSGNPADEWCAFSDTSLVSLEHVVTGMQNIVLGKSSDPVLEPERKPLLELIAKADPDLAAQIDGGLNSLLIAFRSLKKPMDQLIKPENSDDHARLVALAASLDAQAVLFQKATKALRVAG